MGHAGINSDRFQNLLSKGYVGTHLILLLLDIYLLWNSILLNPQGLLIYL